MRTELRAFVTSEQMDAIDIRLREGRRTHADYEELEALQMSIDDEVDRQEMLLATELKNTDLDLKDCPYSTEPGQ